MGWVKGRRDRRGWGYGFHCGVGGPQPDCGKYSETQLVRTPPEMKKRCIQRSTFYPECDVRLWESERYNRVYVLTRVRTNRVSLFTR